MLLAEDRYIEIVPKVWGKEYWICNTEHYCAKLLKLKPGYESSYHYHPEKDETFHIIEGSCILNLCDKEIAMGAGTSVHIAPQRPHSFWTSNPDGCLILEISTHHEDRDVVRLRTSRPFNVHLAENQNGGNCT